jgi:hypothetical protein
MLAAGKKVAERNETVAPGPVECDLTGGDARGPTTPIQGQLLRLTERREVAIFLCEGALWVADFIDGDGELIDAVSWFRFHCAALSTAHARHRMVLEAAIPLSDELVTRIESLRKAYRSSV